MSEYLNSSFGIKISRVGEKMRVNPEIPYWDRKVLQEEFDKKLPGLLAQRKDLFEKSESPVSHDDIRNVRDYTSSLMMRRVLSSPGSEAIEELRVAAECLDSRVHQDCSWYATFIIWLKSVALDVDDPIDYTWDYLRLVKKPHVPEDLSYLAGHKHISFREHCTILQKNQKYLEVTSGYRTMCRKVLSEANLVDALFIVRNFFEE